MLYLATVSVFHDGKGIHARWQVMPDAHHVGVTPCSGRYSDDLSDVLGTPAGADVVSGVLAEATRRVVAEFRGAWDTVPLF